MLILTQFVLRLAFGLAAAMLVVSPRHVTSGYFRNNLYVLLGINVLAVLLSLSGAAPNALWLAAAAAGLSYIGAVCWLFEQPAPGLLALALVAAADLAACYFTLPSITSNIPQSWLIALDPISGGLLLGTTMAAMLLGHWYLNAPGMPLAPLERLIALLGGAVLLRAVVAGLGLCYTLDATSRPETAEILFLSLRWIGGLAGTLLLTVMSYRTLKIPNTQSATGILYVAVITTFLGELASGLLSARFGYPL